jgi:polyisoprenoid-binding protein YceI
LPLRHIVIVSLLATACVPLTACSPPAVRNTPAAVEASAGLADHYASLRGEAGSVFTLDPAESSIRIYVFRTGAAARLGHNHVLAAPRFTGFVFMPSDGVAKAQVDLEFRLDELEIDNPLHRAGLGRAFASSPSPEAIEGTRRNMLGADDLDAERFPYVRVHSLRVAGESPKLAVEAQVTLHGQERTMWLPVTVQVANERLTATGSLVLRQSDFGARPFAILGGAIAVQDEIVVEFALVGK